MKSCFRTIVMTCLLLTAVASKGFAQDFPAFRSPAVIQPQSLDFAASSTTAPNGYYGTAVVTGFSTYGNTPSYAVSPDGQNYTYNQAIASVPYIECSPGFYDICGVGVANYNGTVYMAYADTAQELVILQGTYAPGNIGYSFSVLQVIPGAGVTTVPSLVVFNNQLLILYGSNTVAGTTNAYFQVTCSAVGAQCSAPDSSHLGSSAIRVASAATGGLSVLNNVLYLCIQQNNSNHQLFVYSTADGVNWNFIIQVSNLALGGGAQMVTYNNNLVLAAQQNSSNHALFIFSSPDGVNWSAQGYGGILMGAAPGLTLINGGVSVAFKSNDSYNRLFASFGY